ncbi:MAG: nucleotidyltransferase [Bacteroidia bacterium]|nr:nucleotidyltransferase [Bacteroidia bacterium]
MQLSSFHKEALKHFFSSKPVKRAYVFGSYVKNEADQNSDIDILVELDHSHPIGMKFFSYKYELEELLKVRVDLLSTEGLSRHVKPHIDKDKVLIYERTAA